ncbi:MAG: hypothetical protein ACYS1C_07375, partial [Planctomycetota bacterium]
MNLLLLMLGAATLAALLCCVEELHLFDFEHSDALPPLEADAAEASTIRSPTGSGRALQIETDLADSPAVTFPAEGTWDWSDYTGLAVDAYNPGAQWLSVYLRVNNEGADAATGRNCNSTFVQLRPRQRIVLVVRFNTGGGPSLWGMREYPIVDGYPMGPLPIGSVIDAARVTSFAVALSKPSAGETLVLENFRLWKEPESTLRSVKPFVDPFGQYKHEDWPGKVEGEQDLVKRAETEKSQLEETGPLPGRDEYGGWADGPNLEATGWFRAEKVGGNWWLVTPEGSLFFSTGIDCVVVWYPTFISKRDDYFEWLPERDGPFADCYGFSSRVHSHNEPLEGTGGETFNFYQANLIRKYGQDWYEAW